MIIYTPRTEDALLDASSCRDLDRRYVEELQGDTLDLMERAGQGAAEWILDRYGRQGHALILCGKGNNGGDGLVLARYLLQSGWKVHVHSCHSAKDLPEGTLSPDAATNWKRLPKDDAALTISIGTWPSDSSPQAPIPYTLIIDALLGTGFRGSNVGGVVEPIKSALEQLSTLDAPIIALDVPSGLDATTGTAVPLTPVCTATLTFGALKRGLYFDDGPDRAGEVVWIDLGFPEPWRQGQTYLLRPERLTQQAPKRRYKYDGCRVMIIGGSTGMIGAPLMAARAAWSMDLGDVRLMYPAGCSGAFETHLPFLVHHPLGANHQTHFSVFDIEQALEKLQDDNCVVIIGPGMGKSPDVMAFCRNLLASYTGRLVVDADALQAFALSDPGLYTQYAHPPVITPHPGELRYFNHQVTDNAANSDSVLAPMSVDREEKAQHVAKTFNSVVVAKGYPTVSVEPSGRRFVTGYDTRVFNKVGYGDVLAGLIGAYMALGASSLDAALAGQLESERRYRLVRLGQQETSRDRAEYYSTSPWELSVIPGII